MQLAGINAAVAKEAFRNLYFSEASTSKRLQMPRNLDRALAIRGPMFPTKWQALLISDLLWQPRARRRLELSAHRRRSETGPSLRLMTQTSLSGPVRLRFSRTNARQPETTKDDASHKAWRLVRRAALPLAILAVWEAVTAAGLVSSASLPSPGAVAIAGGSGFSASRLALAWYSGTWGSYVLMSLERVAVGFAIASVTGIVLGVLIGWYSVVEDLFRRHDQFSPRRAHDRVGAFCRLHFRHS